MNKKLQGIKRKLEWCLAVFSLLTLSCNRADIEEGNISKSGFLVTLEDDIRVESRSTPAELEGPLSTEFNLKIVRSSTGSVVYNDKYTTDLIQASAGFYQITASFGDNPVLGVDAPYYEGTVTDIEVKKSAPVTVSVPCKVANALLSVVYDKSIANVYESYYVTVSIGEQSQEIRDAQSAYFHAGSVVNVWFHGTPKGESEERTFELLHEGLTAPLEAGEHAILNLSIEAGVNVSVEKLEVKTTTVSETIPVEYMPKPKLESTDFVNNELSFGETAKKSAVINLKLASPLQDLKLKFTSADSKFAGLEQGREYLLSVAEDKAAVEKALGITLPSIGVTEAALDFSSLVPQLMTDNGAAVSSVIEVDAKANNRWSSDKEADALARTFTLNCNKPVFHVSIYPGNIWTKEFTVNHLLAEDVESGDYEALGQKMRYQFSTNGTDGWTDLGKDLRKADLIPGTTYYIRGLYRDVIESEAVAVTTYPQIALENGGLQGGSISYGSDKRGSKYGAVYVWSGWASLNELTCDDTHAFIAGNTAFNSRSGTRVTTDARQNGDGEAVWISTIGWGYGGTSYHTITSGELFLGSLANVNHDNDTATKSYGISYASHPTSLRFWYKYAPFNGDKSDIYIQILGNEGEVLGKASLNEANIISSYTECLLDIEYDEAYLAVVPAKLVVVFKTGNNLSVEARGDTSVIGEGDPAYRGSELYIDDISLVYDK